MSKLITTSRLTRFWTNAKSYVDNALVAKADASHTHDYAASSHTHSYNDLSDKPTIPTTVAELSDASNYALVSQIPESMEIATDDEIDALFE